MNFQSRTCNVRRESNASGPRRSADGVALVITLIMLAVITFMAITFLVVATADKNNTSVHIENARARAMADVALEAAGAQVIAQMMASSNTTVGFMVSTTYTTPGFILNNKNFTNVSYCYPNGAPLNNLNDLYQNLDNMVYLPPAPVWVTNTLTGSNEARLYLDLNRNHRYDTNGYQPVLAPNGNYYRLSDGALTPIFSLTNILWANVPGDPQWVGVLERSVFTPALLNGVNPPVFPVGFAHSPSNRFEGRYAFLIVPTSSTLDINSIYNYGKQFRTQMDATTGDGYFRNQNAGTWEMNLAAFLTDLDTNMWPIGASTPYGSPYFYDTNILVANRGAAFDDAFTLLRYRYGGRSDSLDSVSTLFGPKGIQGFGNDHVDGYVGGPLVTGFWPTALDRDSGLRVTKGWWGADNTNHFFDSQDFFDPNKAQFKTGGGLGFTDRLNIAGTNGGSYDSSIFYRLLSQLGTDSAPEPPKLNVNYVNVDAQNRIVPNLATNFDPWIPEQFFTNAIVHLLTNTFTETDPKSPFCITNYVVNNHIQIQIYPTNYYTPAVHRLMQLAANIYDATTNRTFGLNLPTNRPVSGFPTVFQPVYFDKSNGRRGTNNNMVFITGYQEVTNPIPLVNGLLRWKAGQGWHDLKDPNDLAFRPIRSGEMVVGIPLVIGAKKGFPSFNQMAMQNMITVSRKLNFHRPTAGAALDATNQYFNIGISNVLGVELWNSYNSTYAGNVQIYLHTDLIASMTNEFGQIPRMLPSGVTVSNLAFAETNFTIAGNTWTPSGLTAGNTWQASTRSFIVPIYTNSLVMTNATYVHDDNAFYTVDHSDPNGQFPIPRLALNVTARLRLIMVDTTANRIIDYVNLSADQPTLRLDQILSDGARCDQQTGLAGDLTVGDLFCTNRAGNPRNLPAPDDVSKPSYGVLSQILASMHKDTPDNMWANLGQTVQSKELAVPIFLKNIQPGGPDTQFSAFTATRVINQYISWQANDPLVHYTVPDLLDSLSEDVKYLELDGTKNTPFSKVGGRYQNTARLVGASNPLNSNYRPWNVNGQKTPTDTTIATMAKLELKDPSVVRSDDWQFLTNKWPGIGWLGRVHRGTPWKTVYLKAPDTNYQAFAQTWLKWSSHVTTNWDSRSNSFPDYAYSNPTNDYRILDLFTAAFNDNATRGQLSVNQTNLAAWSAVLAGVVVNPSTNSYQVIEPAGPFNAFSNSTTWPPLARIVDGINRTRTNTTITPGGRFQRMGDLLRTPELTVASPYVGTVGVSDAVYERIPQQILGLIRGDEPRYVIYVFGQALKPAENSVVSSGANFNLCTNYQVTAETAARAVVHIEGAPDNPHMVIDSYNPLPSY